MSVAPGYGNGIIAQGLDGFHGNIVGDGIRVEKRLTGELVDTQGALTRGAQSLVRNDTLLLVRPVYVKGPVAGFHARFLLDHDLLHAEATMHAVGQCFP